MEVYSLTVLSGTAKDERFAHVCTYQVSAQTNSLIMYKKQCLYTEIELNLVYSYMLKNCPVMLN